MNVQERDELLRLLRSLEQTRVPVKDFAAETLILDACARQPDALYLLVQRVLALQAALAASRSLPASGRPAQTAVVAAGVAAGAAAGVVAGVVAGSVAASWLEDLDPSDWL